MSDVCRQLHVPLWLDRSTLAQEGVGLDTRITLRVRGVTGRSILNLLLTPFQLAWLVDDEVLKITTATKAADTLVTRAYDVTDLVTERSPKGPHGYDFSRLIGVVTRALEPDSWEGLSGPGVAHGAVAGETRILAIRQTQALHEKVQSLLADIRAATRPEPENRDAPLPSEKSPIAIREAALRRALDQPVTLDLRERPLDDALRDVAKQLQVNLVVDSAKLSEEGVALDQPVTLKLSDISAQAALKLLLEPAQLTWLVQNEVLFITTTTCASDMLEARVFDVSDLVMFRDESGVIWTGFNSLIDLLMHTIEPDSWEGSGPLPGFGFRRGERAILVIPQTAAILDEIAAFLAELRRAKRDAAAARAGQPPRNPQVGTFPPSVMASIRRRDPRHDALARGMNQFAIELYGKLAAETKGNLVCSPYCISSAIAMAHAGAQGETAREISETMHYILRQEDVPPAFGTFGISVGQGSFSNRLERVSHIWLPKGIEAADPFRELSQRCFGGEVTGIDLADRARAAQTINDWIVAQGGGSILRAVQPEHVPAGNRFILGNLIRFIGGWTVPFPRNATRLASFSTGERGVDVALMHLDSDFCRYAAVDGLELLEKSYGDRSFSLILVLPAKARGSLVKLESALTENNLARWLGAMEERSVEVFLPRFQVESALDLKPPLESLGIRRAFNAEQADFSGITRQARLSLGTVIHKAYVEVDERGSRPLFESGAHEQTSWKEGDKPVFRADRPFLFLVRNNFGGHIVFIGRVVEPEPTSDSALRPGQPQE